jgi:hypothetical protein
MGHYDEQREKYEERQETLAKKRSRLMALGYDPDKMEKAAEGYRMSKSHLEDVPYHQAKVDEYEASNDLKWDEFNV